MTGQAGRSGSNAVLSVLLGSALFGTSGVARTLGPGEVDAAAVGAARVLIGGLCLVAFALARRKRFAAARSLPWTTVLLGASVAVYQSCYFSGIGRVGVSMGSIITVAVVPVATGVVAFLLRGERPGRRWYAATALAIVGTVAASGAIGDGRSDAIGIALCLTAGTSVAFYTVLSRRLLDAGAEVTEVTTVAVALSGVLLLPVLAFGGAGWLTTPSGLLMGLYLGAVTSALGFWLNARGLRRVSPTAVATLNLAEPVTAVVLAFVIVHERPTWVQWGGAFVVCLGLVVLAAGRPGQETRVVARGGPAGGPAPTASVDEFDKQNIS
ncbi:EamA family transporter [Kitasatospora sp. NPDC093806]|uniref:DMT family transporter n=1 Tax=Kitasatospora sp. NPDC093806 TaxID=3155075 RepID=UPI00343939A4